MSKLKNRFHSLSAQLLGGVLISIIAAVAVFLSCYFLGTFFLDRTVYGGPFSGKMADRQFESLQSFVRDENITEHSLKRLDIWCRSVHKVHLTVYANSDILVYDSTSATGGKPVPERFNPAFENSDREYTLVLSGGTKTKAFLYYYAGDAYYYWVIVLSVMLSFLAFSLCFITLIHRKLQSVKRLKKELDILAGGDLSYQVTVDSEDELGELAAGIDQMRRSIVAHQNAEEQIRSANSQLVTAMSHDLRTPLTSLLAYLELMDRGKYEDEEQLRYFISRSLEKTLRIKTMADKLFEYFLVYSSEWEQPETEPADADGLLQQFFGEYAFSLESRGYTVHSDFGRLNGSLEVSIDLLRRAFDNLYSNILKYAEPSVPVELAFYRENDTVHITLSNGVSAERDEKESTNIGLSTCRRVLQYHGGSFTCGEENGLFKVHITLPIKESHE